jgi:hypothetical protein
MACEPTRLGRINLLSGNIDYGTGRYVPRSCGPGLGSILSAALLPSDLSKVFSTLCCAAPSPHAHACGAGIPSTRKTEWEEGQGMELPEYLN